LTLMVVAAFGVLLLGLVILIGAESLRRRPLEEVPPRLDLAADLDRVASEERSRSIA
jgi:hypothetical protein